MSEFHIVPLEAHHQLVEQAFCSRGFDPEEARLAAEVCASATRHGIRTHNALKALHLDELFGSTQGGCVPGAPIEKIPSRFPGSEIWNANRKLGQAVATLAIERAIELADQYGIGQISVDNAFHYLWGGGYVMAAAQRGYLAYTNCTSTLAEVVPFGGKFPTLGTNPHSWAFPTQDAVDFPLVIDWATSTVAMGRVQQLKREGKPLPPQAAVDAHGQPTTDPAQVAALLPFGAHKGYGLSLINELTAALIGGGLPTQRGKSGPKPTANFYFQVIHPEALASGDFGAAPTQSANLQAILADIRGHGNENALLPGELEARFAQRSDAAGGLLFSPAEIEEFHQLATQLNLDGWQLTNFPPEAPQAP